MAKLQGSAPDHPPVLYFVVGDWTSGIVGYTWRIGTSGTSFYLKSRYTPLSSVKISLHGPDPRPDVGPSGFKIGIDYQAEAKAAAAGGAVAKLDGRRATWFPGRPAENGAVHAITFRSTWDLFQQGVPSAPGPGDIKQTTRGLIISPPPILVAADIEIYVASERPYWRNERQARKDNACLGPIRNRADQYLTGVSARRSTLIKPTPKAALATPPSSNADCVRGIGTVIDDEGVLWVVEQFMSRKAFESVSATEEMAIRDVAPPLNFDWREE